MLMFYDSVLPQLFSKNVLMEEMLTLNMKDQARLQVLNEVEEGRLEVSGAGGVMSLPEREV